MPHLRRTLRHDDIPAISSPSSIERNSNDNGINNRQSNSISGGIIGGNAFYDANQNGINDDHLSSSSNTVPTNINIWLFTCNPNETSINMGHYKTNDSGVYTFNELDSGNYYIVVQKPEGYEFTSVWRDVNNQQPIQSSSSTTLSTLASALKQSIAQQFSSSSNNNTSITNNVEYSTINPEKGQTTCFTIKNNEVNMNIHFGLYRISNDDDISLPSLQPSSTNSGSGDMSGDMSNVPTVYPSYRPSDIPSYKLSYRPSAEPTSTMPSDSQSIQIKEQPTQIVSSSPSISSYPSQVTSSTPSNLPSSVSTPTSSVSNRPSLVPSVTNDISNRPSGRPSLIISNRPTSRPSHSNVPSSEGTNHDIEDTNHIPTPTLKPSKGGHIDSSLVISDSPSSYPSYIPSSMSLDSSSIVTDNSNISNEETSSSNNGIVSGGIIFGILSLLIITIELLVWHRRKRRIKQEEDGDINNDIVISTTNNSNNEEPSPLSNESTIVHRGTSSSAAWHEVDCDIEQSNRTQDPSHRSEEDVESKEEEDTSKGDTSKDTNSSKDSWFSTTVQSLWNQHYRRRGSTEDDQVPSKVSKKVPSSKRREQNSDSDLTAVRVNLTSSFLSGSKKRSEPSTMSNDEHKDKLEQEMCTLTNIIEGLSKGSPEYMLICSYLDKTIQELTIMKQDQDTNNYYRRGRSPPSRVHYSSSSRSGGISDSSSISSSNSGGSSFVSSTGSDSVDSVDWRQFMPKPGEQGLPDSVQDALVLVDEIQKESLNLALEDASGDHQSITETNLVTSAKHEIQSLEHELNSLSTALETYPRNGKSWQLLHSYFEKVKEELDSVRNDINVLESSGEDLSSSVDSYLTNSGRNTPVDLNDATTTSSNNNNLSLKDIVGIYNPNNADSLSTVHEGLDESTFSDYEKSLPSLISSSESEQDQNLSLHDIEPPLSSKSSSSSIYTDSLNKVDDNTAHTHTETNPYVVSPGSSEEATTVESGNSDDSETRRIFGERRRGEKTTRVQSQSPKRKNILRSSGKDDQFSVASSSGWSTCDDHSSSSDVSET